MSLVLPQEDCLSAASDSSQDMGVGVAYQGFDGYIKYSICDRHIFYTKQYTYIISKYEYRLSIYDTVITYINITNY